MSQIPTEAPAVPGAPSPDDVSPNETLAQKVIDSLIDANLISPADGERIRGRLAAGDLDEAGWKLAFENQLEREAVPDGR